MLAKRRFLVAVVAFTLAPVFTALPTPLPRQAPLRTAANINQLADAYTGVAFSNRDTEFQNVPLALEVDSRTRNRFTGEISIDTPDGTFVLPCTGTVSGSGRVSTVGRLNTKEGQLTATLKGQLSANGQAIIGTYSVNGRDDSGRFSDRGTFALLEQAL